MAAPSKLSVMLLPALALLAACSSTPHHEANAVVVPPPPPPMPGALGTPGNPSAAALSGTTVAPGAIVEPNAPMRMSATDIATAFANNTAEGVTANGLPYAIYFGRNGQERFRQGSFDDSGTWQVLPDGRFCSSLVRISANSEECYIMYRTGDVISFQRPDGVTIGSVRVVPGNPQNL